MAKGCWELWSEESWGHPENVPIGYARANRQLVSPNYVGHQVQGGEEVEVPPVIPGGPSPPLLQFVGGLFNWVPGTIPAAPQLHIPPWILFSWAEDSLFLGMVVSPPSSD